MTDEKKVRTEIKFFIRIASTISSCQKTIMNTKKTGKTVTDSLHFLGGSMGVNIKQVLKPNLLTRFLSFFQEGKTATTSDL